MVVRSPVKALFCRRRRRASGAFEGLPALKPVFDSPYACTVRQVGPQECKERNFALSDCQNVRISVSQRGARGMASSAPSSSRGAAATLRPEQRRQRSLRARRCRRRPAAAAAAGGGSAKAAHINWTNDAECKCVVLRALMRIDVLGLRGDLLGAPFERDRARSRAQIPSRGRTAAGKERAAPRCVGSSASLWPRGAGSACWRVLGRWRGDVRQRSLCD